MFKFLKEKIKSWIKKTETEEPLKTEKSGEIKEKTKERTRQKEKFKEKTRTGDNFKDKLEKDYVKERETEKKSYFDFLKKKLTDEKFEELFSELEIILLQNNVALEVVEKIKSSLKEKLIGKSLSEINLQQALKSSLEEILINPPYFIKEIRRTLRIKKPFVICFVGINGSGKTTTIAKIAALLKKEKFSIYLAAADTFRAASIEQLEKHALNLKINLIKKEYGADPASVGFDAVHHAKKHQIDIVLIDTAGRMNTKDSLMKEMEKIIRVNKPDMTFFVGEAITGNDATEQARAFSDIIPLTGIILSKADIDEKGGTAISVSYVTKKPIFFLGIGQKYEDLEVFDKDKIISGLGL